ncbi:phosphate uptake regulator PhoU [Candidatus Bipolaricaulota bacterium]|nr:phosphate uptake regulator PhoU [Candidatus Bipolaricaulota bacterium]
MFTRKVQKTGGSTYFVTLPKQWAEGAGITTGAKIHLIPNDSGALLLVPKSVSESNRCTIDLQEWEFDRLQREVIARYIAGFDIISVRGKRIRPEQRRMVREISQSLVGLEIFEETQQLIVLHSLVNIKDFPVHKTVERVFDITKAMLADAVIAFCEHDEELAHDVMDRDRDIDRLVLLVARQFSLLLRDLTTEEDCALSRPQFLHYHEVADQLERVADHAAKISEAALALAGPVVKRVSAEIKARSKDSNEVLNLAVRSFVEQDTDLANQVLEMREQEGQLFAITRRIASENQPAAASSVSIALDSLLRIAEYGFNIAENALDAPVSSSFRPAGS